MRLCVRERVHLCASMEQQQKKILCVGLVCLDIINVVEKYPEEDTDSRLAHAKAAGDFRCKNADCRQTVG